MSRYGKKGYIRTIEAVIAIVAILIFIFTALPRYIEHSPEVPSFIDITQKTIVNNIVYGQVYIEGVGEKYYRDIVFDEGDLECSSTSGVDCLSLIQKSLENLIGTNLPGDYDYAFRICDNPNCLLIETIVPADKTVYMEDVFLSPSSPSDEARIFRFWIW